MNGHASFNRCYTLVWSEAHQTYVVTHEGSRRKSKRSGAALRPLLQTMLAAMTALVGSSGALAGTPPTTVVPTGGNTVAYTSPNGVPVVDINTANAAGLSHNTFTRYDVEANGLVLNNANTSQMARQSELAGQVMANTNLAAEARIILNEVVSPNRSILAGFTEVVGGKADVIIANPYGITCAGCGYINTDRVTLTTGTPNIAADGSLTSFTVNRGDILINANGLNASAQQVLDLVSRSVKLDGQINATDLGVAAGNNTWNYTSRNVTGNTAASGPAPSYAIDSTVLGGMYAGRIRIVATEAGVGVRMLGDAAATAADFSINAAGSVALNNKISAERDLTVASSSSAADAVKLSDASLTARRNLALSATQGGVSLNGGALVANNDLSLSAKNLADSATSVALADNNKRYAGNAVQLNVAQNAVINGTAWGAGSALNATVGSLNVGASGAAIQSSGTAAITASIGNLSLATAAISAAGDLSLSANAGAIQTSAGSSQGVQSTAGNVQLNASAGLQNTGIISAKAGNLTARINGNVVNDGTLHAKNTFDLADKAGAASVNITNNGTMLAEGALNVKANTLSTAGNLQGTAGSNISATTLNNSGLFVASAAAGSAGAITAATLNNTGIIQSAQDLSVNLSNGLNNSGKILATRDLALASGTAATNLSNTSTGVIQAGNALSVTGSQAVLGTQAGVLLGDSVQVNIASLNNSGTLQANNAMNVAVTGALSNAATGKILGQGGQSIAAASLNNAGTLQANGAQTINISNAASNTGTVLGKGTQTVTAGSLNNSGTWQADQCANITVNTALVNSGTLTAGSQAATNSSISAATFDNQTNGVIQSANNLNLTLTAASLSNAGKILATGDLGLAATGSTLQWDNLAGAYLQAGGSFNQSGAAAVALSNNASANFLANRFNLALASLNNAGTMQAGTGASTVNVANTLTNSGTLTLASSAAGSATVTADTVINTGQLQSQGAAAFNIGTLFNNSGTTLIAGDLTMLGTDSAYAVNNTNRIESLAALKIQGQGAGNGVTVDVGDSAVLKGASLLMNSSRLTIAGNSSKGGIVNTTGAATLNLGQLNLGGSKSRIVAGTGTSSITINSAFSNPGAIFANGDLILKAQSINNSSTGGLAASGNLWVEATSTDIANRGALYAGKNLTAKALRSITNYATATAAQGTIDASDSISIIARDFTNQSTVTAAKNITVSLTGGSFHNDVSGNLARKIVVKNKISPVWVKETSGWCFSCGYDPERNYYYETWDEAEEFISFNPATAFKPQIIAGNSNTLAITGFSAGTNKGGVISGGTVQLTGASGTSSFAVDALTLTTQHIRRDWNTLMKWYGAKGAAVSSSTNIENDSGPVNQTPTYQTFGAGIFAAYKLGMSTFGLTVAGGPKSKGVTSKTGAGVGSSSTSNPTSTTSGATTATTGVSGSGATTGSASVNFSGLTVNLPTNPNGFFVTNQNPSAQYLVETNPLYAVGSNFVGSNYLAERYGYNPDEIGKRLGDSGYEAYLIRQQLISQTGSNILNGQASEAEQMKGLMDNAADQSKRLGLVWGKSLSASQEASLDHDIVWMVETTIGGQKVLAPVVYLSAGTKKAIQTGAVISAKDANLNLVSLTNSGGTISGSSTLNIVSQGDVVNLGGTIKGGDVNLQSTEGSIRNETLATTTGDLKFIANTVIGNTAGIQATGNLSMDAAKDIIVKGGQVSAGGDASLSAGGDVSFDSIEDKKTHTESDYSSNGLTSTYSKTTTATTEQVKSGLTTGGNLSVKSKNDIALAGTDVKVGGDAELDAGRDLNILARANSTKTTSKTQSSGLGVGGGIAGSQTIDTDAQSDRNVGTTLIVGGNAALKAKNDITLEGATVDVKGDGEIEAGRDVSLLDGKDRDYSKTTTTTKTFLKVEKGQAEGKDKTKTATQTGGKTSVGASGGANASASAEAEGQASGGLVLAQTTTTTTTDEDQRSVGSKLSFGGNTKVKAGGDLTLRGSELSTGNDLDVNATNVNVLAGKNIKTSVTDSSTTKVGLMAESSAKASAEATASAGAKVGALGVNANADANATAEASAENRLALVKVSKSHEDTTDVTHNASALKAGGNMKIKATEGLKTLGSSLESGADMDLQAKNMSFEDAQDTHEVRKNSSETAVGLYLDASASASATANAGAEAGGMTLNAQGGASASAGVSGAVSAGLYGTNTTSNSVEGSTTAQVSSIKSGGNMKRTATESIRDVGTAIEAGGDFEQSAETITSLAARNTSYASSNDETNTVKIGAYAEGTAGASASASYSATGASKPTGKGKSMQSGGAGGIKASFEQERNSESSNSSQAVVSTIKSGGKISSKSSGKTDLEGTQFKSGGDIDLEASSLDYRAAANTESSTSKTRNINAELKVDIVNKGGSLEAGYGTENSSASSSEAVVGGIDAGGKLKIKTQGDMRLEGTQIAAGGDAELDAGGKLTIDAARDTQKSQSDNLDVTAGISASKSGKSKSGAVSAAVDVGSESSSSSQAVVSNIVSGGKLKIKSAGDTKMEGTNLGSVGNTDIDVGGNLQFDAARDTEENKSQGVAVNAAASGAKDKGAGKGGNKAMSDSTGGFGVGVTKSSSDSSTATAGSITSGGKLNIKSGGNASFEGTDIGAAGDASVAAKGDLSFDAAKSTSSESSVDVSVGASGRRATGKSAMGINEGETAFKNKSATKQGGPKGAPTRTEAAANLGVGVSKNTSVEAVGGGIRSGGNLKLSSGGKTTLEGTAVNADGLASINAGTAVDIKAAVSTNSGTSVDVSAEGSMLRTTGKANGLQPGSTSGVLPKVIKGAGNLAVSGINKLRSVTPAPKPNATPVPVNPNAAVTTIKKSGSIGVDVSKSKTSTLSSISGGQGIEINAGTDLTMEGTQLKSGADTKLSAGGDVSLLSVSDSSSRVGVQVGIGQKGSANTGEEGIRNSSASTNQGVSIAGAGGLTVKSGGQITKEGTEIFVMGDQDISAAKGSTETDLAKDKSKSGGIGLSKPKNPLAKPSVQAEENAGD